jgi:hypothetical protein
MRNYGYLVMAALGIWTDDVVDAFALKSKFDDLAELQVKMPDHEEVEEMKLIIEKYQSAERDKNKRKQKQNHQVCTALPALYKRVTDQCSSFGASLGLYQAANKQDEEVQEVDEEEAEVPMRDAPARRRRSSFMQNYKALTGSFQRQRQFLSKNEIWNEMQSPRLADILKKETVQETERKSNADHSRKVLQMMTAMLSMRAVLFQVLPFGGYLSVALADFATCPLLVISNEFPVRLIVNSPLEQVVKHLVWNHEMHLKEDVAIEAFDSLSKAFIGLISFLQSRLILFLYNCLKHITIMMIVRRMDFPLLALSRRSVTKLLVLAIVIQSIVTAIAEMLVWIEGMDTSMTSQKRTRTKTGRERGRGRGQIDEEGVEYGVIGEKDHHEMDDEVYEDDAFSYDMIYASPDKIPSH